MAQQKWLDLSAHGVRLAVTEAEGRRMLALLGTNIPKAIIEQLGFTPSTAHGNGVYLRQDLRFSLNDFIRHFPRGRATEMDVSSIFWRPAVVDAPAPKVEEPPPGEPAADQVAAAQAQLLAVGLIASLDAKGMVWLSGDGIQDQRLREALKDVEGARLISPGEHSRFPHGAVRLPVEGVETALATVREIEKFRASAQLKADVLEQVRALSSGTLAVLAREVLNQFPTVDFSRYQNLDRIREGFVAFVDDGGAAGAATWQEAWQGYKDSDRLETALEGAGWRPPKGLSVSEVLRAAEEKYQAELTSPPKVPGDRRLLILACSAAKESIPGLIPAMQRYKGAYAQVVKKAPDWRWPDIIILSAKHGFIGGSQRIEDYDQQMDRDRSRALRADPSQRQQLEHFLGGKSYDEVFVAAGALYRDVILHHVDGLIPVSSIDIAEGGIGEQRSQLGAWMDGGSLRQDLVDQQAERLREAVKANPGSFSIGWQYLAEDELREAAGHVVTGNKHSADALAAKAFSKASAEGRVRAFQGADAPPQEPNRSPTPMLPPHERVQPDMLGGPDLSEPQMYAIRRAEAEIAALADEEGCKEPRHFRQVIAKRLRELHEAPNRVIPGEEDPFDVALYQEMARRMARTSTPGPGDWDFEKVFPVPLPHVEWDILEDLEEGVREQAHLSDIYSDARDEMFATLSQMINVELERALLPENRKLKASSQAVEQATSADWERQLNSYEGEFGAEARQRFEAAVWRHWAAHLNGPESPVSISPLPNGSALPPNLLVCAVGPMIFVGSTEDGNARLHLVFSVEAPPAELSLDDANLISQGLNRHYPSLADRLTDAIDTRITSAAAKKGGEVAVPPTPAPIVEQVEEDAKSDDPLSPEALAEFKFVTVAKKPTEYPFVGVYPDGSFKFGYGRSPLKVTREMLVKAAIDGQPLYFVNPVNRKPVKLNPDWSRRDYRLEREAARSAASQPVLAHDSQEYLSVKARFLELLKERGIALSPEPFAEWSAPTVDAVLNSATKGIFTDALLPHNKASRALFEEVTGVSLPDGLAATKAMFTGVAFPLRIPDVARIPDSTAPDPEENSRIAPRRQQRGAPAQNVATLLHRLGLDEKVLSGDSFHVRVSNPPYLDLVLERHPGGRRGDHLLLTHYVEMGGDQVIDSEMIFEVLPLGQLRLAETAVRGPRGEHRTYADQSFASLFSKNLLAQGFDRGALVAKNDSVPEAGPKPDSVSSAPAQPPLEPLRALEARIPVFADALHWWQPDSEHWQVMADTRFLSGQPAQRMAQRFNNMSNAAKPLWHKAVEVAGENLKYVAAQERKTIERELNEVLVRANIHDLDPETYERAVNNIFGGDHPFNGLRDAVDAMGGLATSVAAPVGGGPIDKDLGVELDNQENYPYRSPNLPRYRREQKEPWQVRRDEWGSHEYGHIFNVSGMAYILRTEWQGLDALEAQEAYAEKARGQDPQAKEAASKHLDGLKARDLDRARNAHFLSVVQAFIDGKPVPAEVLADYPQIRPGITLEDARAMVRPLTVVDCYRLLPAPVRAAVRQAVADRLIAGNMTRGLEKADLDHAVEVLAILRRSRSWPDKMLLDFVQQLREVADVDESVAAELRTQTREQIAQAKAEAAAIEKADNIRRMADSVVPLGEVKGGTPSAVARHAGPENVRKGQGYVGNSHITLREGVVSAFDAAVEKAAQSTRLKEPLPITVEAVAKLFEKDFGPQHEVQWRAAVQWDEAEKKKTRAAVIGVLPNGRFVSVDAALFDFVRKNALELRTNAPDATMTVWKDGQRVGAVAPMRFDADTAKAIVEQYEVRFGVSNGPMPPPAPDVQQPQATAPIPPPPAAAAVEMPDLPEELKIWNQMSVKQRAEIMEQVGGAKAFKNLADYNRACLAVIRENLPNYAHVLVGGAAPAAQMEHAPPAETSATMVPADVLEAVRRALAQIGELDQAMAQGRRLGPRYEAEVLMHRQVPVGAMRVLGEFRRQAIVHGVDYDETINRQGGLPKVALTDAGLQWYLSMWHRQRGEQPPRLENAEDRLGAQITVLLRHMGADVSTRSASSDFFPGGAGEDKGVLVAGEHGRPEETVSVRLGEGACVYMQSWRANGDVTEGHLVDAGQGLSTAMLIELATRFNPDLSPVTELAANRACEILPGGAYTTKAGNTMFGPTKALLEDEQTHEVVNIVRDMDGRWWSSRTADGGGRGSTDLHQAILGAASPDAASSLAALAHQEDASMPMLQRKDRVKVR